MKKDHITTRLIICALVLVFGIVGIAASGDITYRKLQTLWMIINGM